MMLLGFRSRWTTPASWLRAAHLRLCTQLSRFSCGKGLRTTTAPASPFHIMLAMRLYRLRGQPRER